MVSVVCVDVAVVVAVAVVVVCLCVRCGVARCARGAGTHGDVLNVHTGGEGAF